LPSTENRFFILPTRHSIGGRLCQTCGTCEIGSWIGSAGPEQTLEENWISPRGGSIAALVRITTSDATPMVELIVIEEQLGTLVLHVQQWDPGYTPRPAGAQSMTLAALGERHVRFEGSGDGGMAALSYSSPDPTSFILEVETAHGQTITLPLTAR
jgi:hypothetical protein